MALIEKLNAIGDAIRFQTGKTDMLTLDEMATEIKAIQGGTGTEKFFEDQYQYVELPNATKIKTYAFYYDTKLKYINMPNVTSIGGGAFYNCTNLALTALPAGLTDIAARAFYGCTGLATITFKGTPTSISSSAFEDCTNLTTINVPWAEGAVANAPWGATNATINYNYTGE